VRVLVTGGTGLLGWWVVRELLERGYSVCATYHAKEPMGLEDAMWIKLDLEDLEGVAHAVRSIRPDAVIHSAAYTDVDGSELHRDRAYRVNYLATRALARASGSIGAYVVYISTDYVFDGERGMYKEDDVPSPVNFYGLSKLMGEVAVESILPGKSLVVRVSGLYGYSPTGKRNFGINALEKLLKGEEVGAFHDQYLSPTYVPFLARRIVEVLERRLTGTLHLAGERLSRYEFALLIAKVLGRDPGLVKPVSMSELKLPAKRPRDSSLDTSRARSMGLELPPQETCIKHFAEHYISIVKL
jgi:dTDP-4-dehydrorhamnose reductase